MISDRDLQHALRNIEYLDPGSKARVLDLLEERDRLKKLEDARTNFLAFVRLMWPGFIAGAHHTIMAEAFERVARGDLRRLIINMPPRFTKSELSSWLFPAWMMGRFPSKKIIQSSNTEALASGFGRKVRNLISGVTEDGGVNPYAEVFPHVTLAKDSQAAAGWHTNRGGEYFAIGVNGKVTGKGADYAIIDDAHSEQEAKQAETNPEVFDTVWEWYSSGIRQRLQPGGSIIIPMTRWSKRDLTGRLIKQMQSAEGANVDRWEVISFPAVLDEHEPTERSLWPGFWPIEELQRTRSALPLSKWQAQYQQNPTSEGAAILKRESWRKWGADTIEDIKDNRSSCPGPQHAQAWARLDPPACDYIIMSWDTAQKKNERADYSAMTSWGVFKAEDPKTGKTLNNVILLSAFKARMEFPELKKRVKQFYDEDGPDTLLVEDKGSGISLIQEFRAMGIPVENFSYGRGGKGISNDKVARANLISDVFASGYVWAPETRFAETVIEECGEFPNGEHDDYVDSVVQAMLRFRAGGFIRTALDEEEDEPQRFRRKRFY